MHDLITALPNLERQLLTHRYFYDADDSHPRKRSRIGCQSTWSPPGDKDTELFINLVRKDLVHYKPRGSLNKLPYSDLAALRWLRHNPVIMACDADKNLGSILIARESVNQLALSELGKACVNTSTSVCLADIWNSQCMVSDIVQAHWHSRDITLREKSFLLSKIGTTDVGCFRIRPKIHKSPLEGRPVFNFNASWIQPIAIFLSETLNPLVNDCEHVLLNTDIFWNG